MNTVAEAALLTLISINSVVGLLLLFGKVQLVRTRRAPVPSTPLAEVVVPDVQQGKRGRPRKGEKRRYARHLHLPASTTTEQLADASELFHNHQDEFGDRIVLHISVTDGPDRDIEIPYFVLWSDQVKDRLSTILGGWS